MVKEKVQPAEVKAPTKVFISYSRDPEEHKARVLQLANTLREPWGIETDIDEYVRARPPYTPPQGWDLWMEKRIEWAEFVLIVCTETYARRFKGDEEPGVGRGVTWEGTIIRQHLYNSQLTDTKFIPVVFSSQDLAHVPLILNAHDKYVLNDEKSFRTLGYRLRKEPIVVIPEVAVGNLPSPSPPEFLSHPKPSIEPPPISSDVDQIESPTIAQKDLRECDPAKILFIKNVKDPEKWAYSLDRMQQPASRVFELMWRPGSHGANLPKAGDLMILHQRARVTHVVEFLDDQARQDWGLLRWVRTVWIAEQDWDQLPHQKEILGFSPNYSDGNTHSLSSPNFSTFRQAWSNLKEFQEHVFKRLTQPESTVTDEDILVSDKGVDYTRLRDLLKAGKFREADQETANRMAEATARQRGNWNIDITNIGNFPCDDLRIIDELWVRYSQGKFGFSVQKKIWQECGSPVDNDLGWGAFLDRVGWRMENRGTLFPENMEFDTSAWLADKT
jgi:hypothetical protein